MKIIIVDDHPIVRKGLEEIFNNEGDMEVIKTSSNCKEGMEAIHNLNPDISIIDLKLPDCSGIELIHQLKESGNKSKFIVLTSYSSPEEINFAFCEKVDGYILKGALPEEIISAVRLVKNGRRYIDPEIMEKTFREKSSNTSGTLTHRELEILGVLSEGLSNKDISKRFFISEATVKKHIGSILLKLRFKDRTQAAIFAFSHITGSLEK